MYDQKPLVLIHPPALSRRYLRTMFIPYGMAVLTAYLRGQGIACVQFDFLVEYLHQGKPNLDVNAPDCALSDLEYLSFLREGHSHSGLDAFAEACVSRLPKKASLFAFSIVAYHQFWAALVLARRLKDRDPGCKVVFGGPLITIKPPQFWLPFGQADFWVRGAGEVALSVLHRLSLGEAGLSARDVPGAVFLENGHPILNPLEGWCADNERMPELDGLDLRNYAYEHPVLGPQTLFLPYRLGKGCPGRCSFCTGRLVDRYSAKPAAKITNELSILSEKYGSDRFMFADASVNADAGLLESVCDGMSQRLPAARWYGYAQILGTTKDLLSKAQRSGCLSLFWGAESASQPTISMLGKGFAARELIPTLDQATSAGIASFVHVIYNTPHETIQDIEALIRLMDHYGDSEMVRFLPQKYLLEAGSLMHAAPKRYGLCNVRPMPGRIFDRERFAYDEAGGPDWEGVRERNLRHAEIMAAHLRHAGAKAREQLRELM